MNTISQLLKRSLGEHLEKSAIIDNGILSYRQLDHDAACIASLLEQNGAKQGDMVGIRLARSKEYIVAVVACLLYGYGAVLLDIEYPQERIDYILSDSAASVVIDGVFYGEAVKKAVPAAFRSVAPGTGALVVYTSGSTGNPKGVLHDQESVHNAMIRFSHLLDYSQEDICGSNFPYTFISIGADVLYPLCLGATVDVVPRDIVRDAVSLSEYIDSHKITATVMPPKILKVFRKTGDSLRIVATGSERVSGISPDAFRIVNIYGMSEAFPSVCAFELDKAYDCTPIGHGDGSLGIYLLDENGNEAQEGEICITGHIFSGYLNLEKQTRRVLVPNPFKSRDGHETLFHTNDIARRLPDGNLMYENRKDWMVKINGFRVEPGEIECAVKELPQVSDCLVKAFFRKNGTPYLAAYYVEKDPIAVEGIRQFLINRFPYYMIPAYYVRLEAFPVNRNGKLEHKALAEPAIAEVAASYAAPENALEEALCKAMAEAVCLKKVGIHDDFFALGGDYEEVVKLIHDFADQGLTEKNVYKYKTPKKIADALLSTRNAEIEAENRLELSVPQPLTRAQEYYLDYQFYAPGEGMVNFCSNVTLPVSEIDTVSLKKLLESAFAGHPALSSKIEFNENGEIVLRYYEGETASPECYECSEEDYQNSIRDHWRRPLPAFNSLLYYCLIYTTETSHHILLDLHRSICDNRGMLNLLSSIQTRYEGKEPPADYYYVFLSRMDAERKKNLDINEICKIQAFLQDDSYAVALKRDVDSRAVKKGLFRFSSSRSAGACEQAMKAHQTPIEQVMLTAAMLAVGRYNATDKVAVSWLFDGRDEAWEKAAVGLMASAIPVCAELSHFSSLIDLLASVKKQCNVCIEHAEVLSFLGMDPGIRDMLQVEYMGENTLLKHSGRNMTVAFDENTHTAGQLHLIGMQKGTEDPLLFEIQYNSVCYRKESVEQFSALFCKAFDLCCFGSLKDWLD